MSEGDEMSYKSLVTHEEGGPSPVRVTRASLRATAYTRSYHRGEPSMSYRPPTPGETYYI